jgi:hypothetical protein
MVSKLPVFAIDESFRSHATRSQVIAMQIMIVSTPIEPFLGPIKIETICTEQLTSVPFCELLVPKVPDWGQCPVIFRILGRHRFCREQIHFSPRITVGNGELCHH